MGTGIIQLETSAKPEPFTKLHPALVIQTVCVLNDVNEKSSIFQNVWVIVGAFPAVGFEMVFSRRTLRPMKVAECRTHHGGHDTSVRGLFQALISGALVSVMG